MKSQIAYLKLKDRITYGNLTTFRRLHIAEIAEELAVGLTPTREAIIRLHAEGFIEDADGGGFRVRAISYKSALDLYQLFFLVVGDCVRGVQRPVLLPLARNAQDEPKTDTSRRDELELFYEGVIHSSNNAEIIKLGTNLIERTRCIRDALLRNMDCPFPDSGVGDATHIFHFFEIMRQQKLRILERVVKDMMFGQWESRI